MNDFRTFVEDQLTNPEVRREYNRLAPFYRIADQLVLLRKKRSLNQQELAEKAGTTQTVVSRLENAAVKCSLETVIRLAEALDAVVEVQLKPVEVLPEAMRDHDDTEVKFVNTLQQIERKGAVYFGSNAKGKSRELNMYPELLISGRHLDSSKKKRIKPPEIAS